VPTCPVFLTKKDKENYFIKQRATGKTCPVFLTKKDKENMQRGTGRGMFYLYPGYDTEEVRSELPIT
jgi:hypothetical protein